MHPERYRLLRQGLPGEGPVLYWMSRDQRTRDNWALLFAQERALQTKAPLQVVFCLVPEFLQANRRHYAFMLQGLREVERALAAKAIPFQLLPGEPAEVLPRYMQQIRAGCLVADFDPLQIKRLWKSRVAEGIEVPFYEVDAHNIVPCWAASPKQEYGAYTLRPKIQRRLFEFLEDFPPLKKHPGHYLEGTGGTDWAAALKPLPQAGELLPAATRPGEKAAAQVLGRFIETGLAAYDHSRNDPLQDGQSRLSPYLHFGQISAQRVAWEVQRAAGPVDSKKAFLEELIVRRELSDNFCFYNPRYDRVEGFPDWAKKTLDQHRKDPRDYLYRFDQWERGATHDDLWNAAQQEMVRTGKMHGYLRMYWAKKILEWTAAPEEALETAIALNDRYELDGRDPNGYAGIAWSLGGVHDRPWGERKVFGKIRYMSYNGCKGKFDVKAYISRHLA
ncbi:MAG: deoxyribodipyrimidine photo-lyase [Desulfobacterota bacterium]|jgi:deoxyribodipyrimidine photo-lyase|nr:deoxyribodipyrimidine photo-lyase [Thermodesulfobacteriota bacterium]